MKIKHILFVMLAVLLVACGQKSTYKYETVPNDPLNARVYTLKNGLKVYLSANQDEPRMQTMIAVRSGSKQDPADATGLAHYLEHMLFKGTSKLATTDWEKESALLQKISDLYELRRGTTDEEQRTAIYKQIDSLSFEAAKFAIANEYDKIVSSFGAKGTNAFTSTEQTVYINDIPANELEKWAKLEAERFSELVLRIFHTELETVYEEFNRGQDSDYRKLYQKMYEELFKKHPYGTQSTIGTGAHLKNPSMVKIHEYFNTYYVPNNMAVIISGDIDFDKTIATIDKYFGGMKSKELPKFEFQPEAPITAPIVTEVYGPQAEVLAMAYRAGGAKSNDPLYLEIIDGILSNGQAGLIDLNLINSQKVLSAGTSFDPMEDYSTFMFFASPREGQSLDETKKLFLEQIELIKKGEFEDWLVPAVINNIRLDQMSQFEDNGARAFFMLESYILGRDYKEQVNRLEAMKKVTKEEIVKFANEFFGENYVEVKKLQGVDTSIVRIEKPAITALEINRESESAFHVSLDSLTSERIEPLFVDFKAAITREKLNSEVPLLYIKNQSNELFDLYYLLDMGSDNSKEMALAVEYLKYLGTDKYSSDDLKKEFFKLGLSFDVFSSSKRTYVSLSGLGSSLEEGVKLFEHILGNVQANPDAYKNMVDGILKERSDAKLSKGTILFSAMNNYAKYGKVNPFTNILSEKELRAMDPSKLIEMIKSITSYKHQVMFYGQASAQDVASILNQYHVVPAELKDYPAAIEYQALEMDKNKVYFVNYDMVQTEMLQISRSKKFDANLLPKSYLFGEYFGSGLSSIVFQEIREAKALAYSAYSYYSNPSRKDDYHYINAYIGTQSDKLNDAAIAMNNLMNNMPEAPEQFASAKDAALKKIETERTTKASIFFAYLNARDLGFENEYKQQIYEGIKATELSDLKKFFEEEINGAKYSNLVIGKKSNMKMDVLKQMGEYKELTLTEIFGY